MPNSRLSSLDAIACVSATSCMAVGFVTQIVSSNQPLAERWNGVNWSIVSIPSSEPGMSLGAVYCGDPSNCTAVGGYIKNSVGEYGTVVEHWNGRAWSRITSPNQRIKVLG